ncbi:MAG: ABC transporter ATP-binding protein [Pseudomonadota bacterium]
MAPHPTHVLEVDGVRLRYGDHQALSDVSFSIKRGALAAVVGPNGAGKSTLVKAICGRMPIDGGAIMINGKRADARAARACLGVAPQRAALYDALTARENLICFARFAGVSKQDAIKRAQETLALIGMEAGGDTQARNMSGGMRQRVNIGAAIAHGPALVILDEPSANLDPQGVTEINGLIARLKQNGYGVLLITHDLSQAENLADTVVVMKAGRVCANAAPDALVASVFQDAVVLSVSSSDADALNALGFQPAGDDDQEWRKAFNCREKAFDALSALSAIAPAISSASVAAHTLEDAFSALVNNSGASST